MSIRWYSAYSLSYWDIEEMMAERGFNLDHSILNRWVINYSEQLESEFRKKYKRQTGSSWRMDQTYIKIKGQWHYLYRAVDKAAAFSFFNKSIGACWLPDKITIDKSDSNLSALEMINYFLLLVSLSEFQFSQVKIRQIKYLNNIVEKDLREIKRIKKPMRF